MSENLLKQEPYWENYHSMVLNEPTHKIHQRGFIIITLNVFRVTFFLYVISCNVVYSIKWLRANIYCSISIKIQQPVSQQLPSPPLRFQRPLVSIVWLLTRGRDSDLISHTHTRVRGACACACTCVHEHAHNNWYFTLQIYLAYNFAFFLYTGHTRIHMRTHTHVCTQTQAEAQMRV